MGDAQRALPTPAMLGFWQNIFSRADCDRTRSNGFKLKEGRDIRKKFFTVRVVRRRHELPREVGDAPSLETRKGRLDGALSDLIPVEDVPAHGRGIGQDGLRRSLPTRSIL